jgi:uncharacterized SAM-binding protein YcdF (DUF218 family)
MINNILRRYRKIIIIIAILIIAISIFRNAGNFLAVNETPEKSDAIVVLGGGSTDRINLGVKLLKEEYGSYLILSSGSITGRNNEKESEVMKNQALESGVREDQIIIESRSTSTYENAVYSKQLLEKDKAYSAIIVTSNYHMRRSRLVFNKVFAGTGIKLTYCASQAKRFKPNEWFLDSYSRNTVLSEYAKLAVYGILGRL